MATWLSLPGGPTLKSMELSSARSASFGHTPCLAARRKLKQFGDKNRLSVRADSYRDGGRGGGSDFLAGFLLGGAVFGTLAYVFAPQIRRSLLNEDEYGFRRAKRPIYYDEGLEKTRQTLNAKISQLNSAIDNVSSRLRGGNNSPTVPVETDPEVEATM
ncbi:uncharacterized protein LOC116206185 [Punica granatum]|uniref:Uncharacterized protein n=2 Tax=Punica granatum TaxID=22663 RepID=A0A2I0KKF8_PUNGR|nr:uncharacterized protein LOC116206185 [Punica granatum]PKI68992.1 hypothetical protein CRG98_010614 [Punica granatum]